MRKGRLNSMVVSFQSPTPRTGKEGCFKRLGLCPEEALEELQSFTLHKTSPRKGSTRPCGKAVAGMGWSGPALYTGRPDPAVPVPNPSCRQRGLSLGDKGASGQAATATFLQSCSFNNIGYEKLQNGYQIFICFFFFFFLMVLLKGTKSTRGVPRDLCCWKTRTLKPSLNGYGSPAHVRAFQSKLEGQLTKGTLKWLLWYTKPLGWQGKSS